MLSKEVSSTVFKVFGMTQPGIKFRSPGPWANTLPTRPMRRVFFEQFFFSYFQRWKGFLWKIYFLSGPARFFLIMHVEFARDEQFYLLSKRTIYAIFLPTIFKYCEKG